MSTQLVIKSRQPRRMWLKALALLLSLGILSWLMYNYGQLNSRFQYRVLEQDHNQLKERFYSIGQINNELRRKSADLERAKIINAKAYEELNSSIVELQNELSELREEVAFYRGIVSPKEAASGLSITSLKIHKISAEAGYRVKLILTQLKKNDRLVLGKAILTFDGLQNNQQKQLQLSDVSNSDKNELKVRFKYFQTIQTNIVLPRDFVPSSVLVDLVPSSKDQQRIKKSFDWDDIVT